jgi:hypothetical protein
MNLQSAALMVHIYRWVDRAVLVLCLLDARQGFSLKFAAEMCEVVVNSHMKLQTGLF